MLMRLKHDIQENKKAYHKGNLIQDNLYSISHMFDHY